MHIGIFEPDREGPGRHRIDGSPVLGHHAAIGFAVDQKFVDLGERIRRQLDGRLRLDAVKRRLHRAGGDFERLQDKGADGQRHDRRDHEDLHVLTPAVPGRGREELVAELHDLLVQLFEALDIPRLQQGRVARLQGRDDVEVARRKNVLRVDAVALQAALNQLRFGKDLLRFAGEKKIEHMWNEEGRTKLPNFTKLTKL